VTLLYTRTTKICLVLLSPRSVLERQFVAISRETVWGCWNPRGIWNMAIAFMPVCILQHPSHLFLQHHQNLLSLH
jgi:hypothetical protein